MTLPKDPYEATTEALIAADGEQLVSLESMKRDMERDIEKLQGRIAAYRLSLEGYRERHPKRI